MKSEYESGTEGHHHQDVPISQRLSQLFESSPVGYVTCEEVTSSSMSRAGISIRNVLRQLKAQDSDHDSAYLSGADNQATSIPLPSEKKEVLLSTPSSQTRMLMRNPLPAKTLSMKRMRNGTRNTIDHNDLNWITKPVIKNRPSSIARLKMPLSKQN